MHSPINIRNPLVVYSEVTQTAGSFSLSNERTLTHEEPVTYKHFRSHTLTMCSLIRMLSFGVTNPWTDRSCTETNSVYPNPRGFMSLIGRLNAPSSGRDIMVSQMCWLESLGFTSMKVIRPVNGHSKLSSWSVRIRCMWRAIWVRSFGDRFNRAQNLQEQTILKCSFALCTPLSPPDDINLLTQCPFLGQRTS